MKKLFFLILISIAAFSAQAQIRHVRHIKSVDVLYGKTAFGQVMSVGYVTYKSNTSYLKGSLFYENGVGNGIAYTSMGAEGYYAKTLLHAGYTYYLNAIGGAHLSVDNAVSSGEFKLPSTFKYGVQLGIENEIFINDKFVFIISFTQHALMGANYGNYRWFANGGIRYNF